MDHFEISLENKKYRLEFWKTLLSVLTPLVLVALTFVVNDAIQERGSLLKREEQILAEKQRIYTELGRKLNIFYVYVNDIGDFRSYTPPRVVELKREADRQFFMYKPYWSETSEKLYNEFMRAAFLTYTGVGLPAKINSTKDEKVAAYDMDKLKWDSTWDVYFTGNVDAEISTKYYALVSSLLSDTVNTSIRRLATYIKDDRITVPVPKAPFVDTTAAPATYHVCVGDRESNCPPHNVFLSCDASVADWAAKQCDKFNIQRVRDAAGSRCGYEILEVTCTKSISK